MNHDTWTAWTRDQKRIVGSGRTFDEAKQAAAAAGESSVLLTKSSSAKRWSYAVAVFIALVPGVTLSTDATLPDGATAIGSELSADLPIDHADEDL